MTCTGPIVPSSGDTLPTPTLPWHTTGDLPVFGFLESKAKLRIACEGSGQRGDAGTNGKARAQTGAGEAGHRAAQGVCPEGGLSLAARAGWPWPPPWSWSPPSRPITSTTTASTTPGTHTHTGREGRTINGGGQGVITWPRCALDEATRAGTTRRGRASLKRVFAAPSAQGTGVGGFWRQ